jgi:transposase
VDRTPSEGIAEGTALVLGSAVGLDRNRWPTEEHFGSGRGLCRPHQISGGRVLSGKVRPGVNRAAQALRLAARTREHSRSALGAYGRRLKGRLGAARAITAAADRRARLVASLPKHGQASLSKSREENERERPERQRRNRSRKARTRLRVGQAGSGRTGPLPG